MNQILLLLLLSFTFQGFHISDKKKFEVKITSEESKLYDLINDYRKSLKLSPIPLSRSLTYVAQQHCKDLVNNKPDLNPECNAHSWSDDEKWTGFCYTSDHKQARCMWNKPSELTNYPGFGFEIACGSSDPKYSNFVMTAEYALEAWKNSFHHNNVIINEDKWSSSEWKAIGIGIYKGFATVWFGKPEDTEGEPLK